MDIKNINQRDPYAIAQNAQLDRAEYAKVGGQSAQAQAAAAPRSDKVSVSEEGVLRTEAYRAAMSAPEVRQDKVDAIKARIADGGYQTDSRRIAAAMVSQEAEMLA